MTIFRSIKPSLISQGFGKENTSLHLLNWYLQLGLKGHNGLDFPCPFGTPVYFPCSGKGMVIATGVYGDGCMYVKILTDDEEELLVHRFLHLKDVAVSPGQTVESGDLIAHADNTGKYTTGSHLHYDLSPVFADNNSYLYTVPDNGYGGQIDPTVYFKNIFILDYLGKQQTIIELLKTVVDKLKELIGLKK